MVLERILLQTIKFDLQVEHPYQFLLRYAKQLKGIKIPSCVCSITFRNKQPFKPSHLIIFLSLFR